MKILIIGGVTAGAEVAAKLLWFLKTALHLIQKNYRKKMKLYGGDKTWRN
jgi:hypothetical protein